MSNIRFDFNYPWLLLLIIPAVILALLPHLRLNKHRRRTRNRITSLVLHIIIIVLLILTLTGFNIKVDNSLKKNDVIFLVDASDSTSNVKEEIDEYLENVIRNYQYENKIGFVVFGNNQLVASNLNSNPNQALTQYKNHSLDIKKNATNFEDALLYSINMLEDSSGRIIVVTDGKETDGDAVSLAKQYSTQDIQIDAVYFDSTVNTIETQINDVILEDNIQKNKSTNIEVSLQSNSNSISIVNVYDNDQLIKSEAISTRKGITNYQFEYSFSNSGMHKIKVALEIDDTINENNAYYTFVNITEENKILVVDGTGYESNKFVSLVDDKYQATVVTPSQVLAFSENLDMFGEVILMNVSNEDLPDDFSLKLENYVIKGGSLLTTGGKNTYYFGEMANTRFSEMLPIEIEFNENEPISIFIILDISSSMAQKIGGSSKTKLELAKEGAIASVNALQEHDYVGVIAFDATAEVVVPLSPVSQKEEIIEKIENIEVGYGTAYVEALNLADGQFIQFAGAKTKHIIFLSDGVPTDSGYVEKLVNMRSRGVTASTFGIGDDVNTEKLEELAKAGDGNFYKISAAYEFNEYMVEETVNKKSEYLNEGKDYTPKISSYTPLVNGLTSLPSLDGFIGATPKDGAVTILECDQNPIYCEWEYGDGKVGSFMSDLSGDWSSKYFEDERGIIFINNLVQTMYADNSVRKEMIVSIEDKNFSKEIQVRTASNNGRNKITAIITDPNNKKKEINLNLIANNTYSAVVDGLDLEGIYEIVLKRTGDRNVIEEVVYTTFSYSKEYDAFIDRSQSFEFLTNICQFTGGTIYNQEEELFTEENQRIDYQIDLRYVFLISAITLFLLDIVVRKFNFKWPHEIIRKIKQKEDK